MVGAAASPSGIVTPLVPYAVKSYSLSYHPPQTYQLPQRYFNMILVLLLTGLSLADVWQLQTGFPIISMRLSSFSRRFPRDLSPVLPGGGTDDTRCLEILLLAAHMGVFETWGSC